MLEKGRFLAIKNLAKDIRKENEKLFKAFSKESMEDAIREKEEFIESVIDSMEIAFSDGEQGKEEKQIFRANVLIPDDIDFFTAYSKDKNIRNLMNNYAVGIEDVMSKITELNIYGKYIELFQPEEEKPAETDFVDEMVNLSSSDAESLLDEIEDLSSAMNELNITSEEETEEEVVETPTEVEEPTQPEKITLEPKEVKSEPMTEDFDDISNAVSGFVDDYNKNKEQLDKLESQLTTANMENDTLKSQIEKFKNETDQLKKSNLESAEALKKAEEAKKLANNEIIDLKEKLQMMEGKMKQSAELLKKIYNSIPKK